jgi:hypothetical protein
VESATAQAPTRNPSTARRAIVVGFVGGYVRRDNMMHNEVRLATQLRRDYPSDVIVLTFENHHGQKAHEEILRILDTDQDGKLSLEEKQNARIIIYGHSWGASETVNLARELEKDGIPVLLTIQVDSISKGGQNDAVIPANVAQAANFYQTEGLLHGREKIQPADPTRTHIVGNFRSDYKSHPVRCDGYPWFSRVFMKTHIEIECDPNVWNQVDLLIRSNLPASDGNGPSPRIETGNSPPAHSNRSN